MDLGLSHATCVIGSLPITAYSDLERVTEPRMINVAEILLMVKVN